MTFHGRWCHEFQTQRLKFEHGGFMQENRRGRTSHENFPGLFAGTQALANNWVKCGASTLAGAVTTSYAPM